MRRRILLAAAGVMALAGTAVAADLPVVPPPVIVPIFTWTGAYIGGQVGYAWTDHRATYNHNGFFLLGPVVVPFADYYTQNGNANGVIGGAHAGYNLQINQWVLGIEGDVDGSSLSRTVTNAPFSTYHADFVPTTVSSNLGVQGSLRGRVGVAFDRVLLYGTGGVAIGGFNTSFRTNYGGGPVFGPFFGHDGFYNTRVGWTVGGGIEYAVNNNWSIRAEYRYTDFGRATNYLFNSYPVLPGELFTAVGRHHLIENRVQVGFSYKFVVAPPPPVVAKY